MNVLSQIPPVAMPPTLQTLANKQAYRTAAGELRVKVSSSSAWDFTTDAMVNTTGTDQVQPVVAEVHVTAVA